MDYEDDDKISKFNEAMFQMKRLDLEQARINLFNQNPTAFNPEANMYNYELVFHSLVNQFSEISPKLKKNELLEGKIIRLRIQNYMRGKPTHTIKINQVTHIEEVSLNKETWHRLRELLFAFQLYIRKMMDIHNISTPEEDDSGLF